MSHAAYAGLVLMALLGGCATPKEINGRKVLATRWVNGRVVYIIESDAELIKRAVNDAEEATKRLKITPTQKLQPATTVAVDAQGKPVVPSAK